MTTIWVYLPVPAADLNSLADEWVKTKSEKNRIHPQLIKRGRPVIKVEASFQSNLNPNQRGTFTATAKLANVAATDTLYLLAHGNLLKAGGPAVRIGGNRADYFTPEEMADMLRDEGLRHDCKDIRVFACNTAIRTLYGVTIRGRRIGIEPHDSFAEKLKKALVALNYNDPNVYGYKGEVVGYGSGRRSARGTLMGGAHKGLKFESERHPQNFLRAMDGRELY